MKKGFLFDLNKCVGCHACVVACQIENGSDQHQPWREISTYNPFGHPDLPVFHYSLACNHCEDAPCMESCPALAFIKDEPHGTIVHYTDRCIGCKYCTWVCPYDAPKFITNRSIIEKCTLCQHRLEENNKPACANLCPTGALDYTEISTPDQSRIKGFTEKGIRPGIELVRLRNQKPPRNDVNLEEPEIKYFRELHPETPSKISVRTEWVLLIFTLIVSCLTAILAGGVLGKLEINPWLFTSTMVIGIGLSSIHLGKKTRAWRSVLNLRSSWLSREIFGFAVFAVLSLLWFIFPEENKLAYMGVLTGFATSYFIDKVYLYTEKTTRLEIHSSSIFLTSILLTSVLTGNQLFIIIILILKFLLYIYRKIYFIIHKRSGQPVLSIIRFLSGFVFPSLILSNTIEMNTGLLFFMILSGELIDRIEFYIECEIISPVRQIKKDMESEIISR